MGMLHKFFFVIGHNIAMQGNHLQHTISFMLQEFLPGGDICSYDYLVTGPNALKGGRFYLQFLTNLPQTCYDLIALIHADIYPATYFFVFHDILLNITAAFSFECIITGEAAVVKCVYFIINTEYESIVQHYLVINILPITQTAIIINGTCRAAMEASQA